MVGSITRLPLSNTTFRETVILAQSCAADQAHLRSHAGPCASDVFCGAPTQKEFEVEPHLFRNLVLERLRLPLDVTDAVCECGCRLDTEGRHRAACARSGRLRTRAVGPERTLARICREAGALVRCNTKLRDMNVAVPAADRASSCQRTSSVPGSAVGCGRYGPKCTHSPWIALRWGSHHGRRCPRTRTWR